MFVGSCRGSISRQDNISKINLSEFNIRWIIEAFSDNTEQSLKIKAANFQKPSEVADENNDAKNTTNCNLITSHCMTRQ